VPAKSHHHIIHIAWIECNVFEHHIFDHVLDFLDYRQPATGISPVR
jgi:hypothetical protein